MSSNPPKNDAWPPYKDVRLVLVKGAGNGQPWRGLVLDDKVMSGRKWLLVTMWIHDGYPHPHARTDWVLRRDCWPLKVDPNVVGKVSELRARRPDGSMGRI